MGAAVTVIEARDRVGGRVWTIRDGFADRQHAEAGGDMIDEAQDGNPPARRDARAEALPDSSRRLRLRASGPAGSSRPPRIVTRSITRGWDHLAKRAGRPRPHAIGSPSGAGIRPITADLARRSVAQWLDDERADPELRAMATGLRGFFLADPEELSLLALVDQFAERRTAGRRRRCTESPAATIACLPRSRRSWAIAIQLGTELVAVSVRGKSVHATLKRGRTSAPLTSDYLVLALPASVLRRVPITPALPAHQHAAIATLKYGRATKTLLQFIAALLARAGPAARLRLAAALRRDLGRQRRTGRRSGHPHAARRGTASEADAGDGRAGRHRAIRGRPVVARRRPAPSSARRVRWSGNRIRSRAAATRISIRRSIPRCASGSPGRPAGCSSRANTRASAGRAT